MATVEYQVVVVKLTTDALTGATEHETVFQDRYSFDPQEEIKAALADPEILTLGEQIRTKLAADLTTRRPAHA